MKNFKVTLPLVLIGLVGMSSVAIAGDADVAKRQAYFDKWDADGDGQLNISEFTSMTEAQFAKKGKQGAEAEKRFKRRDADGNGFISFEEFNQNNKSK